MGPEASYEISMKFLSWSKLWNLFTYSKKGLVVPEMFLKTEVGPGSRNVENHCPKSTENTSKNDNLLKTKSILNPNIS